MKWIGEKVVTVSSLHLDAADIRARMKEAHVIELAESSERTGKEYIHPPIVRMPGKQLLCGRDRIAGCLVRKDKKVRVRLVECDDAEAKRLEKIENLYRRPVENRAKQIAELVAMEEAELRRGETQAGTVSHLHGASNQEETTIYAGTVDQDSSPQAITAEARKRVAAAAGVSTAAVRKAQQRASAEDSEATKRHGAAGDPPTGPGEPHETPLVAAESASCIDLLGVTDDNGWLVSEHAGAQQRAIDAADQHLRQALAALKPIEHTRQGQELRVQVQRVGELVRSARPAVICPLCKALGRILFGRICNVCHEDGYVTQEVAERQARELLSGDPLVAIDGQFYLREDVKAGRMPPKNGHAKKARGLAVTTTDGVEHDLTVERDDDDLAF